MSLEAFREDVRSYIAEHCPPSMRNRTFNFEDAHEVYNTAMLTGGCRPWRPAV